MATVTPKIGARGTQNINTAYNVTANTLISNRVVCSQFLGPELKNISFNTTNTDPNSPTPIGLVEQLRIDNSGNIAYFGSPQITLTNQTFYDVSCNLSYYNRALEICAATDHFVEPALLGFLRIDIFFSPWTATDYVLINSKVLACTNSSLGPGMSCVGYSINRNQTIPTEFPPPAGVKWYLFEETIGSVTVDNGDFRIYPSAFRAFAIRYQFNPFNRPDNIIAFINLIHATVNAPITDVIVTMF